MSSRIRQIAALALTGFVQLVRTRVYLNLLVGGVALVLSSLAFDRLSAGESGRVLRDTGMAFIALLVAVLAGTMSITTLTRELETKQIHLLVARPIPRSVVVLGRFCTTALLVVASNLVLGGLLAVLVLATGNEGAGKVFIGVLFASLEGWVVAAIAIFFGTGSSSTMAAVFTATLFVLGRLSGEMHRLVDTNAFGPASPILDVSYRLLPHLADLDLTGWLHGGTGPADALRAALYACLYCAAFLAFAVFRLSRRDLL